MAVTPEQRYEAEPRSGWAPGLAMTSSYGARHAVAWLGPPSAHPVWARWTWASTIPGMIHRPARSTTALPSGTGHSARLPAHAISPPRTTTTASATGTAGVPSARVVPSISVAPTSARTGGTDGVADGG